jgi:hypothetical protein
MGPAGVGKETVMSGEHDQSTLYASMKNNNENSLCN